MIQYGAYPNVKPPGYYGIDSETQAHDYKTFQDPAMQGAQCLSAEDYKKSEAWVQAIIEIAKQRCQ